MRATTNTARASTIAVLEHSNSVGRGTTEEKLRELVDYLLTVSLDHNATLRVCAFMIGLGHNATWSVCLYE